MQIPNALNQYSAVGTASPIHDLDGNLMDDGSKLYFWDAENRLVSVHRKSDNAVIAQYRYDYMSRRIYKETTAIAPQGVTASIYHYDGWNLCAEYHASAINGATDAAITSHKRSYTWGMDLSGSMQGAGGVGGLLAIEEKAGTHQGVYYPLYDGNGNVTELVKEGGATGTTLVAHYEYDPFGNLTQSDDGDGSGYHGVNPFRFSTKYFDEETDFYYYGYRYYDPVTGRWPSRDPIGEKGGVNVHAMVRNRPTVDIDRLGLEVVLIRVLSTSEIREGTQERNKWLEDKKGYQEYIDGGKRQLEKFITNIEAVSQEQWTEENWKWGLNWGMPGNKIHKNGTDRAEILKIAKKEKETRIIEVSEGGIAEVTKTISDVAAKGGDHLKIAVVIHGPGAWFPDGSHIAIGEFAGKFQAATKGKKMIIANCGVGDDCETFFIDPGIAQDVRKAPRCKARLRLFGAKTVSGKIVPGEAIEPEREDRVQHE